MSVLHKVVGFCTSTGTEVLKETDVEKVLDRSKKLKKLGRVVYGVTPQTKVAEVKVGECYTNSLAYGKATPCFVLDFVKKEVTAHYVHVDSEGNYWDDTFAGRTVGYLFPKTSTECEVGFDPNLGLGVYNLPLPIN